MSVALTPEQKAARYTLVYEMRSTGKSYAAIARELGYGEEYLRSWMRDHRYFGIRQRKPNTTVRSCLKCRRDFDSVGIGNRMCASCASHAHIVSPYEPDPGGAAGRQVMRHR